MNTAHLLCTIREIKICYIRYVIYVCVMYMVYAGYGASGPCVLLAGGGRRYIYIYIHTMVALMFILPSCKKCVWTLTNTHIYKYSQNTLIHAHRNTRAYRHNSLNFLSLSPSLSFFLSFFLSLSLSLSLFIFHFDRCFSIDSSRYFPVIFNFWCWVFRGENLSFLYCNLSSHKH
jgi:hypothetical protein